MVPVALSRRAPGDPLKKAILAALALAAGVVLLVPLTRPAGPPPQVVQGRSAASIAGEGALRAGAARVRIELLSDAVIAGYPGHRRADEPSEPVYARAIALEAGPARAYIASIETLLIPAGLEEEVLRRARLPPPACLLLTATHTHSGPGGTWNNLVAGWAGTGAFDRSQRDLVAQAAAEAIERAAARLGPAGLRVSREPWVEGPAQARSEGPLDPDLLVARIERPDGETVATLVGYAMHPTSAPRNARHISADWPGVVSSTLEAGEGAPALVLQGAVGNSTWSREPGMPAIAERTAAEAQRRIAKAASVSEARLTCATRLVALPAFTAPPTWFPRTAASNVLGAFATDRALVQTHLRVGALDLLGVPGEPVGELGLLQRPAFLVGLADGYFGYVETAQRWREGRGEAARTQYGPGLAHALELE